MARTKVMTVMRWVDEVNQEENEHNEVEGMMEFIPQVR